MKYCGARVWLRKPKVMGFSYEVDGVQYIAVTAGGGRRGGYANLIVTPGVDAVDGSNAVYVFALPGN